MTIELIPSDVIALMSLYAFGNVGTLPYRNDLFDAELIEPLDATDNNSDIRLTEGGEMLIAEILKTKIPVKKWCMP